MGISSDDTARRCVRRFDIFAVRPDIVVVGDETRGTRPYLIVSPDSANKTSPVLSGAPLISKVLKPAPSRVPFRLNGVDSTILLDLVGAIDRRRLRNFLGRIDKQTGEAVARALNFQFIPEDFAPEPLSPRFELNKPVPLEEDRRYEFKEVTSPNAVNTIRNTADEYAVAFLNSEGGRIFWGIRDADRTVVGVNLTIDQRDALRKAVTSKLIGIQPQIDVVRLRLSFHPIHQDGRALEDLFVVELAVPRGDPTTLHFTSGDEAFVRLDGVKQKLKGPGIQQWIVRRTKAASGESN